MRREYPAGAVAPPAARSGASLALDVLLGAGVRGGGVPGLAPVLALVGLRVAGPGLLDLAQNLLDRGLGLLVVVLAVLGHGVLLLASRRTAPACGRSVRRG